MASCGGCSTCCPGGVFAGSQLHNVVTCLVVLCVAVRADEASGKTLENTGARAGFVFVPAEVKRERVAPYGPVFLAPPDARRRLLIRAVQTDHRPCLLESCKEVRVHRMESTLAPKGRSMLGRGRLSRKATRPDVVTAAVRRWSGRVRVCGSVLAVSRVCVCVRVCSCAHVAVVACHGRAYAVCTRYECARQRSPWC